MDSPLDRLTLELQEKVNEEIDTFAVARIVELFKTGVLSLGKKKPTYYNDLELVSDGDVTFYHKQTVWLRYEGDELIENLQTQTALAKFRLQRCVHLLKQSEWAGSHCLEREDRESEYLTSEDYEHDRIEDIHEAEQWLEDNNGK